MIWERVRGVLEPPPALTISEFADREIVVTTGPLAGTKWQTDFAPYQRGIMNAFHEAGVETVVVMGSSQWGKTACAVNIVAYHIAHDPGPTLVVQPTVDPLAKDFARNRLNPVIEASPILASRIAKARSRNASNTTLAKSFRGGSLAIAGANSAASLAVRSVRLLVLDEIDRYPPELAGEGSTIEIARKRTQAYRRRRRILMLSTPTLDGGSIHSWFQQGDQRRYFVPCPYCGHMHVLAWANVRRVEDGVATDFRGDGHDPRLARLVCPACGSSFGDAERLAILSRGEWRPMAPERADPSIVSFHLWEAYSPLSSLAEIVSGFLRARVASKGGDRSVMHTWVNTTLGEPVPPDDGEGVEPDRLLLRREPYGAEVDVPDPVVCLTLGLDVQDDRLEGLVVGWAPGEESWLIDRLVIPGDTSRPEPWAALVEARAGTYRHRGGPLGIAGTGIDSAGHRTSEVYDFVHRHAVHRVYATIGRDGQRPIVSSPSPRKWGRGVRQIPLYTIGVDTAKALVMSRLQLTEAGPGYVHLPLTDWADEELVAQLTAERLVTRWQRGIPTTAWQKIRARNEMLDAYVLALAALRLLNPRLDVLAAAQAAKLAPAGPSVPGPGAGVAPARPRWLPPPRRGWLR